MLILQSTEKQLQSLTFSADSTTLYASHSGYGVVAWNLTDRTARPVWAGGEKMLHAFVPLPGGRWAVGQSLTSGAPRNNPNRLIDLQADTSRPFLLFPELGVAACNEYLAGVSTSYYDEERPSNTPNMRLYGFSRTADGPRYAWHVDISGYAGAAVRFGPDRFVAWERMTVHTARGSALRQYATARRAADGSEEAEIDLPRQNTQQLLGSPDGSQLVARWGNELHVWSAADWKQRPRVVAGKYKHTMAGPAAAFDPSGRYLLVTNDGPSVLVYDTTTWKQVRKWKWDAGVLRVLAIAPDRSLAAATGPRGRIVVWDLDL